MNVKEKKLEKLDEVIKVIDYMDIKDRLRLGVCMSSSAYTIYFIIKHIYLVCLTRN